MLSSNSISSDSSGEEDWPSIGPVPPAARPEVFPYTIHTYVAGHNDIIDKSFTFILDQRVNRQFTNQLFRSVDPLDPCLMDIRSRVGVHSKVMVLRGVHKDKGGVVIGRQMGAFRILVEDSSVIVVRRAGFKLLDHYHYLPFGVPIGKWACTGR